VPLYKSIGMQYIMISNLSSNYIIYNDRRLRGQAGTKRTQDQAQWERQRHVSITASSNGGR
jgi:hypothetical protein